MIGQALVGPLGFWFQMQANLIELRHIIWEKLVNGAPSLALLFPNVVGLALIRLWALTPHLKESRPGDSWLAQLFAGYI